LYPLIETSPGGGAAAPRSMKGIGSAGTVLKVPDRTLMVP